MVAARPNPATIMIHPIGFLGWRVAISAPTVEKLSTMPARTEYATTSVIPPEAGRNNCSSRESARATMESSHPDQASQDAARRLIPPLLRPCSVALSVTTALYSSTVSRALRQALRSRPLGERLRKRRLRNLGMAVVYREREIDVTTDDQHYIFL